MERFFRIDDKILKFMTVQLEENADVEAIKEEIAEKERKAAEAAAQAEKEKPAETEAEAAGELVDAETSGEPEAETEIQEKTTEEE
jgi:small subunit ribosomal protein S6